MSLLGGVYVATALNHSAIPQAKLDISNKTRSNPLRWKGQFSPQLVQALLDAYAATDTVVFDPFLGSGTVLLEAGLSGLTASGTEINPAAVALARIYRFINIPPDLRRAHLNAVSALLEGEFSSALPLFQYVAGHNGQHQDSKAIKSQLPALAAALGKPPQRWLLETLITLLDFYQSDISVTTLFSTWNKIKGLTLTLPFSKNRLSVFHADARRSPLPDASVDLVVTSPPYINVFNYHQQYRASMEALNWNLLDVAKSEIGSNRKHRGNRFLTVIQFCLDISQTFKELIRVCRPNARMIFVVGRESTVRGTAFFNGEIVTEVAHRALGFELALKQERVFRNRFGKDIFEDILHFFAPNNAPDEAFLDIARLAAGDVLAAAYSTACDEEVKNDIKLALEKIDQVYPSPLLDLKNASNPKTFETFSRFAEHIHKLLNDDAEDDVLSRGYF